MKQVFVHNYFHWKDPMSYLALAIRIATGAYYNHTGLLFTVNGERYLVHAVFPCVRIVKYNTWYDSKERDIDVVDVETDLRDDEILERILMAAGTPYDLLNLFIYMPVYILTGIWIGTEGADANGAFQCYELLAYLLGKTNSYKAKPVR